MKSWFGVPQRIPKQRRIKSKKRRFRPLRQIDLKRSALRAHKCADMIVADYTGEHTLDSCTGDTHRIKAALGCFYQAVGECFACVCIV
jgi:hypothetical protein